jgi:hypothetical protein
MRANPLAQAQREGLIEPAYNELGVRIGWVLTRRGRRREHSQVFSTGLLFLLTLSAVAALAALTLG